MGELPLIQTCPYFLFSLLPISFPPSIPPSSPFLPLPSLVFSLDRLGPHGQAEQHTSHVVRAFRASFKITPFPSSRFSENLHSVKF